MTYPVLAKNGTDILKIFETNEVKMTQEGNEFVMECVKIVEILQNNKQISIVVGSESDYLQQTIFHVTDDTIINHRVNKRRYMPSDLVVGQTVSVRYGEMMTLSLPPQTVAKEIILLD